MNHILKIRCYFVNYFLPILIVRRRRQTYTIGSMNFRITGVIAISKLARAAVRLRRRGGSALPGLVAETLAPDFLHQTLSHLPDGIIIITGTNGKTTTTKMVADLLSGLGKKVLTNKSGSNFTRGIAATVVEETKLGHALPHDIAVIELDEAYAKKFVQIVRPRYVVALNVIRDQLDRFGEIDTTARLIESVLQAATGTCVINADDPRLLAIGRQLSTPVSYYSVSPALRANFPTDEELHIVSEPSTNHDTGAATPPSAVELTSFDGRLVQYTIDGKLYPTELSVTGQYNFQNAASAIAAVRLVMPDTPVETLLEKLSVVQPAFGRGESLTIGGRQLEIILVKNPAGFQLALRSFAVPAATMIAINDNDADGRDVSWLWDVSFGSLQAGGVSMVSGLRGYDMALRLKYDEVHYGDITLDLATALRAFVSSNPDLPLRVYCTYTAMLPLHAMARALAGQERAL